MSRTEQQTTTKPATIWTPANIVTSIRIVFVPFWVAFASLVGPSHDTASWISGLWVAIIYAILAATDKLDGYLARSRNEITRFGKFLDPIADKLIVVAAFLILMDWGYVNLWVIFIVVVREFLVSAMRMVIATDGVVIAASNLGKWKTATTMCCICGFLLVAAIPTSVFSTVLYWISEIALIAAVVLTIWSGVDYFMQSASALFAPEATQSAAEFKAERAEVKAAAKNADNNELPEWDEIVAYAGNVLDKARSANKTLGTAESCTGGLVEAALTAVPGSSDVVKGAIGSYANNVKHDVLKVDDTVLDTYGAVSAECAAQMAEGAVRALSADIAVSVTGIAGPGGGSAEKPVGLVWFGLTSGGQTSTESTVFKGDRSQVRKQAVIHALQMFEDAL